MISGVALMLVGQVLFWGSWVMVIWASVFILINHVYFVLDESRVDFAPPWLAAVGPRGRRGLGQCGGRWTVGRSAGV